MADYGSRCARIPTHAMRPHEWGTRGCCRFSCVGHPPLAPLRTERKGARGGGDHGDSFWTGVSSLRTVEKTVRAIGTRHVWATRCVRVSQLLQASLCALLPST